MKGEQITGGNPRRKLEQERWLTAMGLRFFEFPYCFGVRINNMFLFGHCDYGQAFIYLNLSQISFDASNVLTTLANPTKAEDVCIQPVMCPGMKRSNPSVSSLLTSTLDPITGALLPAPETFSDVDLSFFPAPTTGLLSFPREKCCIKLKTIENPNE
jgi:hypothetical protein